VSIEPQVTEYTIAAFQQDERNGHHWRIQIRRAADGWWAIHHAGYWLQQDRTFYPDARTAIRFADEHDAIGHAQATLRALDINGVTWNDMVERWGEPS
jgi:hypothetical protein